MKQPSRGLVAAPAQRLQANRMLWFLAALLSLTIAALAIIRVTTGHFLAVRSFARWLQFTAAALQDEARVTALTQGQFKNVVFLHHSVGEALIARGDVRERLSAAGYSFWDQGYNAQGLRGPDGAHRGYGYFVPGDNTDSDGIEAIFTQPAFGLPLNTLSGLLQHEVIIFKSCFPNNAIADEGQLEKLKGRYLAVRATVDQHPDKLFIILTTPPLHPAETDSLAASRARVMAEWLKSNEFLGGRNNLAVFDLYGELAGSDPMQTDYNMLRREYQPPGVDSHPNELANQAVGPVFADFIIRTASQFKP